MPLVKEYDLELTDFEEEALEVKLKERDIEIAISLYNLGDSLEKISNVTKLSIEELEKILKNIPQ